jgi:hypothetical protein
MSPHDRKSAASEDMSWHSIKNIVFGGEECIFNMTLNFKLNGRTIKQQQQQQQDDTIIIFRESNGYWVPPVFDELIKLLI